MEITDKNSASSCLTLTCAECGRRFHAGRNRAIPLCGQCAVRARRWGKGPRQSNRGERRAPQTDLKPLADLAQSDSQPILILPDNRQIGAAESVLYYFKRFNRYQTYDGVTPDHPDVLASADRALANQIGARMGDRTWLPLQGESIASIPSVDLFCLPEAAWAVSSEVIASTLQGLFVKSSGVGAARLTKALHRKRPALLPICDRVLVDALGSRGESRAKTVMSSMELLRVLNRQHPGNIDSLQRVANACRLGGMTYSTLRLMDILIWVVFGPFPMISGQQWS